MLVQRLRTDLTRISLSFGVSQSILVRLCLMETYGESVAHVLSKLLDMGFYVRFASAPYTLIVMTTLTVTCSCSIL
jgi:hypothetical protein